jgi:hypothetical protein
MQSALGEELKSRGRRAPNWVYWKRRIDLFS